jgi:elongin-A
MATNIIIKNISQVAGLYMLNESNDAVRRILSRITSPAQLAEIESNSPNLRGQLSKYWMHLIRKDFPTEVKRDDPQPDEETEWWDLYETYRIDKEEQMKRAMAQLGNAFNTIAKSEQKNRTTIVENRRSLPRAPRDGRALGSRPKGPTRPVDRSTLSFGSGSRTKDPFKKVLRQAKDQTLKTRALGAFTGSAMQRTQLLRAPKGMVEQARVEAQNRDVSLPPMPSTNKRKSEDLDDLFDDDEGDGDDVDVDNLSDEPPPKRLKGPSPPLRTPRKSGLLPGKPGSTAFLKSSFAARPNSKSPRSPKAPSSTTSGSSSKLGTSRSAKRSSKAESSASPSAHGRDATSPPQQAVPRKLVTAAGSKPRESSIFMKRKPGRP